MESEGNQKNYYSQNNIDGSYIALKSNGNKLTGAKGN